MNESESMDLIIAPVTVLSDPQVLQDALASIKLAKTCTNMLLSRIVYEAHHNELWKQWPDPYDTFEEWGLAVLEKKKSMLYALSKTWDVWVVEYKVSIDRLKKIDFSKLAAAAPHVKPDNVEETLDLCENNNLYQLQKILRSTGEVSSDEKPKTFKFEVTALQSETVEDAIDTAKELCKSEIPGKILEYICADFLCQSGLTSQEAHLEKCVKSLENAFNVSLEVKQRDLVLESGLTKE